MPLIDAERARLYYEVHGEGRPLVLAHGAGGNAAVWWQQVPAFAGRYRVITFDHRGFGRSLCDPDDMDATLFERDLARILDHAGVERAALVCQSMGGITGVRMAAFHPERVAGLVLANTPGAVVTEEVAAAMGQSIEQMRSEGPVGSLALSPEFCERNPLGEFLYHQINAFNPNPVDFTRLAAAALPDEALAGFAVPTLMITSDLDRLFPAHAIRSVGPKLGARVIEVPGAGHSSYFEKPDVFNALVDEFLRECGW
jgi:pimeloyl-ACP methyl ester carboxylesterase